MPTAFQHCLTNFFILTHRIDSYNHPSSMQRLNKTEFHINLNIMNVLLPCKVVINAFSIPCIEIVGHTRLKILSSGYNSEVQLGGTIT